MSDAAPFVNIPPEAFELEIEMRVGDTPLLLEQRFKDYADDIQDQVKHINDNLPTMIEERARALATEAMKSRSEAKPVEISIVERDENGAISRIIKERA